MIQRVGESSGNLMIVDRDTTAHGGSMDLEETILNDALDPGSWIPYHTIPF